MLNLTCPINNLGYGVVSTNIALSLENLGLKPALWVIGQPEVDGDKASILSNMVARTASYSHTSPSLRIYHQFDLAQHVGKGLHCALPIFELDKFTPREINHLQVQDILFVPSLWAKDVLMTNGITSYIAVVPFGVDKRVFTPSISTKQTLEPFYHTNTIFLNVGKWEVRKGHDILVEAFNKAFDERDEVELVMLCQNPVAPNPEKYNSEWNGLYVNSKLGRVGKIRLLPRLKSQNQVADLMRQADCGVFPARAEGWNLELAEMLAMGKQCIATNYSAHTEFVNQKNCLLIDIDKSTEAYDGVWFKGQGNWADLGTNQVDQLVEHMRTVHKLKQEGKLGVNVEGQRTFEEMTWERTVKLITNELSL